MAAPFLVCSAPQGRLIRSLDPLMRLHVYRALLAHTVRDLRTRLRRTFAPEGIFVPAVPLLLLLPQERRVAPANLVTSAPQDPLRYAAQYFAACCFGANYTIYDYAFHFFAATPVSQRRLVQRHGWPHVWLVRCRLLLH
jgi:hypothetical protein